MLELKTMSCIDEIDAVKYIASQEHGDTWSPSQNGTGTLRRYQSECRIIGPPVKFYITYFWASTVDPANFVLVLYP